MFYQSDYLEETLQYQEFLTQKLKCLPHDYELLYNVIIDEFDTIWCFTLTIKV